MTQQDENLEVEQQDVPPPVEPEADDSPASPEAEGAGDGDVAEETESPEVSEDVSDEPVEEAGGDDAPVREVEDAEEAHEEPGADAGDSEEQEEPEERGDGLAEEIAAADGEVESGDPAYEEVDEASLIDFDEFRPQIEAMVERDDLTQAFQVIEQISRFPDSTRHVPDNLWLYTLMGNLKRSQDDTAGALEAFRAAYKFDPRDLSLLRPYVVVLIGQGEAEEGLRVLQSILLYHKRSLSAAELVEIYHQMGACYEALDRLDKARTAYEKALEHSQADQFALAGLLRVVSKGSEPSEILKVRQRMINSLNEPNARSMALVALGDDYVERFNDPQRALDVYEQAINEFTANRHAVERIATVAGQIGEWRRVSRAYFTLSRLSESSKDEAEWLIKACHIARDQLWEPEKALAGFKRAVKLDPTRLDAFKIVTSILVDEKDWEGLKEAYVDLLAILKEHEDVDPKLLTVLWQNLGELYKTHLNNKREALIAFDQASRLNPHNAELHEQVAALSEKDADFLDVALLHLNALRKLDPTNNELLDRIGRIFLRKKEVDQAYCIFRALSYRGAELDDKAAGFVERFHKSIYRAPKQPLTLELMQRYIFHPQLDKNVSRLFTVIKPAMAEWAGQTRGKYGLGRKDYISLEEELTFNNIYRSIGKLFQYPSLPVVWKKPEQEGLINGAMIPDGMIVGNDLLGSGREKHIAFIVGKQLFLFLGYFYLAAIRPTDLPAYFMLARHIAFPEQFPMDLSGDLQSAYQAMSRALRGDSLNRMRAILKNLGGEADVALWLEAVEDSANRAGFIFCDDLDVVRDYLSNEPQKISQRSVEDRMRTLTEFSISEEYVELRSILGINVA